jgi:hypothetical protein
MLCFSCVLCLKYRAAVSRLYMTSGSGTLHHGNSCLLACYRKLWLAVSEVKPGSFFLCARVCDAFCDATGEVEWVEKVKASSQGNGRTSNSWDLGVHSTSLIELPFSLSFLSLLGQTTSNSNCNIVQHLPSPGEELHPPCRRKKSIR